MHFMKNWKRLNVSFWMIDLPVAVSEYGRDREIVLQNSRLSEWISLEIAQTRFCGPKRYSSIHKIHSNSSIWGENVCRKKTMVKWKHHSSNYIYIPAEIFVKTLNCKVCAITWNLKLFCTRWPVKDAKVVVFQKVKYKVDRKRCKSCRLP